MTRDLGDGMRARCETAEQQLQLLQTRYRNLVGDLAALHRETDRLRQQAATARQDVHRRLNEAFRAEGTCEDFVSRIMLRLVAIPIDTTPAASSTIQSPTPLPAPVTWDDIPHQTDPWVSPTWQDRTA